jgi:two-component system chemotaxis sensor kinase CheA
MNNPLLERYSHAPLAEKTNAGNLFGVLVLMVVTGLTLLVLTVAAPGIMGTDNVIPVVLLAFAAIALTALLLVVLGQFPAASWVAFFDLMLVTGAVSLLSRSGAVEADLFQSTVLFFLGLIVLQTIGVGRSQVIPWIAAGAGVMAWIYFVPPFENRKDLTIAVWNAEFNPFVIAALYVVGSYCAALVLSQSRRNLRLMQFDQEIIESTNLMLEQTVNDRTQALRTILDSSGEGLLTFGADFLVEPDFSAGCEVIFGKNIAGSEVDKLLFPHGGDVASDFRQGLGLYFSGKSRASVIFDLLETETFARGKILKIAYREAGPGKVLVVLTDITLSRHVADRNRADEARRTLVLKALGNKHFFAALLTEAEVLFKTLRFFETRPPSATEIADLLTEIHTFKGNLGFFGFTTTQEVAHDFEYAIQDAQVLGMELDLHDLGLDLKKAYFQELNIITDALGKGWLEEAGGIVIPRSVFEKIAVYVGRKFAGEAHLVDVLEHYRKLPLKDLFSRFPFIAQSTAEKLGKRISPMTILGGELRVPPDRVESLVNSCVHLVNNMVDHGIELPYIRENQGKPPEGRLVLNLVREERSVVIQFIDDGQGISLPTIEAKARSLGLLAADATPSPREILQLLFLPGFSTKEEASTISGRGVGLAAVRQEAEKLGGRVEVQTKPGAGTTFEIILPLGVFANRRKPA